MVISFRAFPKMHALGYNSTHIITLEHIHVLSSFISRIFVSQDTFEIFIRGESFDQQRIQEIFNCKHFLHRGQLPSPRGKLRRTRTNSSLKDQKLKHIALYMALAIKGFFKEKDATPH
ncbi:hypothetical protein SLEP1_g51258 [Rubroshorea leprosula]|uniref:Uncharacterized protein n=1 Tax=Rubroshorea leprosula TaxID=152421 RepID=A0AAV5M3I4_9ROSI|nr:hypothetical protein SLEP1_g51258 [Rubroshorea leprosula]